MSKIEVTIVGKHVVTSTPYNPDFVYYAKKLGGKWEPGDKVWCFPRALEAQVRSLCLETYGSTGDGNDDLVDVQVKYRIRDYADKEPLYLMGRMLAKATSRDSGARLGEGVSCLAGAATSGGSMRNWETVVKAGSVFRFFDVPRAAAIKLQETKVGEDNLLSEVLIIEKEDDLRMEELQNERLKLLERIAEIDSLLAEKTYA